MPQPTVIGVIRNIPLDNGAEDKIKRDLHNAGILTSSVTRLKNSNNQPSTSVRVSFCVNSLPDMVKLGATYHEVHAYVAPVRRCTNCQVLGHTKSQCRRKHPRCANCAQDHATTECSSSLLLCVNCKGPHRASFKRCPEIEIRQKANLLRSRHYIPFSHAMSRARRDCRVEDGRTAEGLSSSTLDEAWIIESGQNVQNASNAFQQQPRVAKKSILGVGNTHTLSHQHVNNNPNTTKHLPKNSNEIVNKNDKESESVQKTQVKDNEGPVFNDSKGKRRKRRGRKNHAAHKADSGDIPLQSKDSPSQMSDQNDLLLENSSSDTETEPSKNDTNHPSNEKRVRLTNLMKTIKDTVQTQKDEISHLSPSLDTLIFTLIDILSKILSEINHG